ncbi:MAG: UvrD-helicase domain-containing protein [Coriobacteriia bacterium]|nr:UvrD-helicase domain-containing protein [Coriobacteriia bacterium]
MSFNLANLNAEQRLAAETTQGPLLLLAGAGTGKTRVLTYRIAHLINDLHVSPYQILAITFTNKAANEMRERLAGLLGGQLRGMWVATFHAMCVRILRADAEKIGFTRDFSIVDESDAKRLFKELYATLNIDDKTFPINGIRARISNAKNELIAPDELKEQANNGYDRLAAQVYAVYQERLLRANAMDFDDLLFNAHRLLAQNPAVLDAYQERFRYLLIDEYQDTNHAQYSISQLLAAKYRNIMVVGDDDQSIYSWRGADIRNILEFEHDYPEASVQKLERNYRSTSTILEAANAVIANNEKRKKKELFTEDVRGEKIALYQASDERDEGRWIASEIEKLHCANRPYADFAVFYRTNAQSRTLEDMLLRAGVPYRIVGGTRFFDRAEIRDVMAYLKCVINPADDISAKRIINTPRRGIGKTTVAKIEDIVAREGCTFLEAVALALVEDGIGASAKNALAEFMQLLKDAGQYSGELRNIVEMIVERSGLEAALEAERTDEAKGRLENIREFFGVAQEFDEGHQDEFDDEFEEFGAELDGFGAELEKFDSEPLADENEKRDKIVPSPLAQLGRFMEWLALRSDLDSLIEGESFVTLMTVHSAKGLEFPVVFIAGLEESIFPHIASVLESEGDAEEERRLAYVAITRARELLHITHAQVRSLFGSTQANPRSRFVAEIPTELLSLSGVGSQGYLGTGWEKRGDRRGIFGSGSSGSLATAKTASRFENQPVSYHSINAAEIPDFKIGDEVDHKVFGRGVVEALEGDAISIRFNKLNATKKLLLGYAPIVKLNR